MVVDGASHTFVTGPDVIEAVTGERAIAEELGGAHTGNAVNGNAHFLAADGEDALHAVRDLLVCAPARVEGQSVGVVANQPHLGYRSDADAAATFAASRI